MLKIGPLIPPPCEPGCSPDVILGSTKTRNGTVTNAIIEYTAEAFARMSSRSMLPRKAKYAKYINNSIIVGNNMNNHVIPCQEVI